MIPLNMHETALRAGGLVCIGVDPDRAPHPWSPLKRIAGISKNVTRGIILAAREAGADPGDWRGTLEPVSQADWSAAECYVDGA